MDNFGWGKTRQVIAEESESDNAQQGRVFSELSSGQVADEENQIDRCLRMPYKAPSGERFDLSSSGGSSESVIQSRRERSPPGQGMLSYNGGHRGNG
jgi:hypothetical protein